MNIEDRIDKSFELIDLLYEKKYLEKVLQPNYFSKEEWMNNGFLLLHKTKVLRHKLETTNLKINETLNNLLIKSF